MLMLLPSEDRWQGTTGAAGSRPARPRAGRLAAPARLRRSMAMLDRPVDPARADALDAADPLRAFRSRFVVRDPDLIYLDGNSLGRLPLATAERLRSVVDEEWGGDLIRAWDTWLDLPVRVGTRLAAAVLGARPGEVIVSDSTTINFYKLALAALEARPGRRSIVTDRANFPTDRYVLEGLAQSRGLKVRWIEP